ncbi:hypothetical protein B0H13DRAFT_1862643 [Mycena leptocephala]|nr:hypothetical protein B0H13DRAFT_1862643 [Mycena leptocephala]
MYSMAYHELSLPLKSASGTCSEQNTLLLHCVRINHRSDPPPWLHRSAFPSVRRSLPPDLMPDFPIPIWTWSVGVRLPTRAPCTPVVSTPTSTPCSSRPHLAAFTVPLTPSPIPCPFAPPPQSANRAYLKLWHIRCHRLATSQLPPAPAARTFRRRCVTLLRLASPSFVLEIGALHRKSALKNDVREPAAGTARVSPFLVFLHHEYPYNHASIARRASVTTPETPGEPVATPSATYVHLRLAVDAQAAGAHLVANS